LLYLLRLAATPVLSDPDFPTVATVSAVLTPIVWLFAAVTFLPWLYRAREDLDRRGEPGLRWRKGWTVGGWFVPAANLVIPWLVVREVYARTAGHRTGLVGWWWIAFLLTSFRLTGREADPVTGTVVVHDATFWNVLNAIAGVVAAVLAVAIVTRVTEGNRRDGVHVSGA